MGQGWFFEPRPVVRRRRAVRPTVDVEQTLADAIRLADREPDEDRRRHELLRLAWACVGTGRAGRARALARKILDRSPRNADALCVYGHSAIAMGRIDEAEKTVQELRLLPQGRFPGSLREDIVALAYAIRNARNPKPAAERVRAPPREPAPERRVDFESPRRAVELPAPPPKELGFTIESRGIDLGPGEELDPRAALADYLLRAEAAGIERLRSFETLLALASVHGVDRYEYQLRTVRRVLRDFRGRVLLADEVGLGKTVEACLCLKEYFLRGLARRALILVPPGLVGQWRDELEGKFELLARVVDGDEASANPGVWREGEIILTSLGLARLEKHARHLREVPFDLVVVDEAHRLKNRHTRSWQLVDRIRSRFLLLLSATPVENSLVEIYNVLSLLKPGLFSTEAEFRRAFVGHGGDRRPRDPERLRSLLREAMIRNTRALAEAKLPPRFAATLRAEPGPEEAALYSDVATAVKESMRAGRLPAHGAGEILRAAGACPAAAGPALRRTLGEALALRAEAIRSPAKDEVLKDLLARRREEKILLFAGHRATLAHVHQVVHRAGRSPALFHGGLSARAKQEAVEAFAGAADVLVASDSGGEGFNLHLARTVVNYDLPWNPMKIEQRIGRVHRIGQARDVFVFNLVASGTLEEEILRVLDEKINMFELVVGEVEAILGRLGDDEKEFQELVLDIYAASGDAAELRARFDALAKDLVQAREEYGRVRRLEQNFFGRELEA
ncbi:MAG: DEAD/DEAH box helicase [Planctomycetaceae bacterium]